MEQSCCEVLLSPGAAAESARHHLGIARGSLSVSTQHGHPSAPRRHRCGLQVLPQQAAACNNMHQCNTATPLGRDNIRVTREALHYHVRACMASSNRAFAARWHWACSRQGGILSDRISTRIIHCTACDVHRTTCSRRRAITTRAMQPTTNDTQTDPVGAQNPQRSQVNVCFNVPSVAALGGAPRRTSCAHAA